MGKGLEEWGGQKSSLFISFETQDRNSIAVECRPWTRLAAGDRDGKIKMAE